MINPSQLKNVNNNRYMFGDFDRDGAKNIDDPKPFDKRVSQWPNHAKDSSYYHVARYGGGEVLLSEELRNIKRHNDVRAPMLKHFLQENPGSFGRIKTVPSTIKKLRERYGNQIMDVAGATILTQRRSQATKKYSDIKKRYNHDSEQTDDYYRKPKGGVYYAYHVGVQNKRQPEKRLEVQIKSKPMSKLAYQMHAGYKNSSDLSMFAKRGKRLFKLGF